MKKRVARSPGGLFSLERPHFGGQEREISAPRENPSGPGPEPKTESGFPASFHRNGSSSLSELAAGNTPQPAPTGFTTGERTCLTGSRPQGLCQNQWGLLSSFIIQVQHVGNKVFELCYDQMWLADSPYSALCAQVNSHSHAFVFFIFPFGQKLQDPLAKFGDPTGKPIGVLENWYPLTHIATGCARVHPLNHQP